MFAASCPGRAGWCRTGSRGWPCRGCAVRCGAFHCPSASDLRSRSERKSRRRHVRCGQQNRIVIGRQGCPDGRDEHFGRLLVGVGGKGPECRNLGAPGLVPAYLVLFAEVRLIQGPPPLFQVPLYLFLWRHFAEVRFVRRRSEQSCVQFRLPVGWRITRISEGHDYMLNTSGFDHVATVCTVGNDFLFVKSMIS